MNEIIIGAFIGITIMSLLQINRENQAEKRADYWEREAKKWCAKLGEIRMFVDKPN
jgi:hypothetical protein